MARLVTFGCSMTYGVGLEDPQNQTWGACVSRALGRTHVNQGQPGASNKFISYKVTNFKYQPDDLVMILWSFKDRYCILKSAGNSRFFYPASEEQDSVLYYKEFYNDFDQEYINLVYVSYTIDFLLKNNIKFYQMFFRDSDVVPVLGKKNFIPVSLDKYFVNYPKGLDNAHLGKEGTEKYSEKLVEYLKRGLESKSII